MLRDVTNAHGGDTAIRSTDEFQGRLEITSSDTEEDKITVGLDIRFKNPSSIRYKVDEGERRIERGRDQRGAWTRLSRNDPAISLGGRDYEGDRRELKKHMGLAAQLLRFLDPASIVELLDDPTASRQQLGKHSCLVITGTADSFPVYTSGGELVKVSLDLFIDAQTDRLSAVRAFPLDKTGSPGLQGEFIYMAEHRMLNGVLVPTELRFYAVHRQGKRKPAVDVRLIQLDLGPELEDRDFDRRRRW